MNFKSSSCLRKLHLFSKPLDVAFGGPPLLRPAHTVLAGGVSTAWVAGGMKRRTKFRTMPSRAASPHNSETRRVTESILEEFKFEFHVHCETSAARCMHTHTSTGSAHDGSTGGLLLSMVGVSRPVAPTPLLFANLIDFHHNHTPQRLLLLVCLPLLLYGNGTKHDFLRAQRRGDLEPRNRKCSLCPRV